MTRTEATRILDAARYGGAQPSESLITAALRATGDCDEHKRLAAADPVPEIGEWVVRDGWIDLMRRAA